MATVGTGIQIDFGSGFLAEIISVSEPDESREAIETTHMGSTTREYIPGALVNPGRIECQIAFDPKADPPLSAAIQATTITYPDGSTKEANAFLTGVSASGEIEERMTQDCVLQLTGAITRTPSP